MQQPVSSQLKIIIHENPPCLHSLTAEIKQWRKEYNLFQDLNVICIYVQLQEEKNNAKCKLLRLYHT